MQSKWRGRSISRWGLVQTFSRRDVAESSKSSDFLEADNVKSPIRVITAAAIFDGHDAAIGIFRRIFQSMGCDVIHLGHDRSAEDVAKAAIQEDAHLIAITSYQGGAVEMFTHTRHILDEAGFNHVVLVGGGGGTILPSEIRHLRDSGIARIYSPDDGRELGLTGMVEDAIRMVSGVDLALLSRFDDMGDVGARDHGGVAKLLTLAENGESEQLDSRLKSDGNDCPVIGLTGTGGAGKSSLTDELVLRIHRTIQKQKSHYSQLILPEKEPVGRFSETE